MNDLGFSCSKDRPPVLDGFSLDVASGSRVFIGGASGSGMTTLLGLLSGVLLPVHDTVTMLGRCISRSSASERDAFRADHLVPKEEVS